MARSFRIDERWLDALSEEAKNEGISPNAILNRILRDYCTLDRHLRKMPTVTLSQNSFSAILEACPKDTLVEIAKQAGSSTAKDVLSTLGFGFDRDSISYLIKDVYGHYGNWFAYSRHVRGGREVFHLRHGLGENWSLYVSELLGTLFEQGLNKKVTKEFLKGSVTIDVPLDHPQEG